MSQWQASIVFFVLFFVRFGGYIEKQKNIIENNWWDLRKWGVSWWYKKCHSDTIKYMHMLCFQCFLTCNKLGLCLSPTSKTRLLDECGTLVTKRIQSKLQTCSLCNLVGDNCDIRITPNHQAIDHQVRDCHYFGVLLFFFTHGWANYGYANTATSHCTRGHTTRTVSPEWPGPALVVSVIQNSAWSPDG